MVHAWLVLIETFKTTHRKGIKRHRWRALTQQPGIDHCLVDQTAYLREIKDKGYKSVFTNSWLVRPSNRIEELGKNPPKIAGSAFCPGPPNYMYDPMDTYMYTARTMARHGWRVDKAPGQNTQKSECAFRHSPICRSNKKLHVYTASDANWLKIIIAHVVWLFPAISVNIHFAIFTWQEN